MQGYNTGILALSPYLHPPTTSLRAYLPACLPIYLPPSLLHLPTYLSIYVSIRQIGEKPIGAHCQELKSASSRTLSPEDPPEPHAYLLREHRGASQPVPRSSQIPTTKQDEPQQPERFGMGPQALPTLVTWLGARSWPADANPNLKHGP